MPGYVGTGITRNTVEITGTDVVAFTDAEIERQRPRWIETGFVSDPKATADEIRALWRDWMSRYEEGGMTPDEAAAVILDGVRAEQWRILVGVDAHAFDAAVRAAPEAAYDPEFMVRVTMQMEAGDTEGQRG